MPVAVRSDDEDEGLSTVCAPPDSYPGALFCLTTAPALSIIIMVQPERRYIKPRRIKMRNKKDPGALEPTLSMALTDAIPVVLFGASAVFVSLIFRNVLFCIGAALCVLAGLGNVSWKLIKAVSGRDVRLLFVQMRVLMPAGFLLIILSLFIGGADLSAVWKNVTGFPCVILFAAGCAGMIAMMVLGITADPGNSRANWLEQTVNAVSQLCFLLGVIIIWYASDSYAADPAVSEYLSGTETVSVSETGCGLFFDGPGNDSALIFYPGGKVDYTAYSPLMAKIAEEGTDCFLCEMPYDLAVFGINRAAEVMKAYSYEKWYIGGHSLGGAMASVFAGGRDDISGLILLGAYPTSQPNCPSLLVYGSLDGVVDREKLEFGLSCENASGVEIPGGNHAWFGSYGSQTGDNQAEISHEEQWSITADAVRRFVDAE